MCIPRQALLGGLIARISREGHRPTREEVRSLLSAGLTAEEISAALIRLGSDEAMDCLVHVQALAPGPGGRGES